VLAGFRSVFSGLVATRWNVNLKAFEIYSVDASWRAQESKQPRRGGKCLDRYERRHIRPPSTPQHKIFANYANGREKRNLHASRFHVAFVTLLERLNHYGP
jgi:hypothetical protein